MLNEWFLSGWAIVKLPLIAEWKVESLPHCVPCLLDVVDILRRVFSGGIGHGKARRGLALVLIGK